MNVDTRDWNVEVDVLLCALCTGGVLAKNLQTAQSKKNIIPPEMNDVLSEAAKRVTDLEDVFVDGEAHKARMATLTRLLHSDKAACIRAAKMYTVFFLSCLQEDARTKTKADAADLILTHAVSRLP